MAGCASLYPPTGWRQLSDEPIIVAGSRYNRGAGRALQDFLSSLYAPPGSPCREYSSDGRALARHGDYLNQLLGSAP
jgi:hypothetical protein